LSKIDDPRDHSRNVYVFGATSFLNDTATEMAYWVLPAFLTTLGAGPAQLGIIEGIAESVASFGKLFSGYLTDRVRRRKPLVVFGYALANVVKPVLALTTAWWQVLLVRFADRSAKGIRQAPRDVMLAESVDKARVGSAFGLLQAMDSAGAIAGPLLALWLLSDLGYRGLFWAAAVPGLLSIFIVALGARETSKAKQQGSSVESRDGAAHLGWRFYYMLAAVTLFSLGNSSDMFLILRAQDAGIDARYAPLLGLVFNLVYTAGSWPAGRLADRMSKYLIAAAGYLVFAIVYVVFATAPSHTALWAMMGFYGLYYALTQPVLRALVADTAPADARGRAFGTFHFASSIAALLASVLTGQLWKHFGAAVPFYISAGLAVLAALMLLLMPRGRRR
jgi:MFS family permease